MKLLNIDRNAKTVKGQSRGYATAILYLAPANLSGYEVCPASSAGCRSACLNTAGRGGVARATFTTPSGAEAPDNRAQRARIAKTRFYFERRQEFMAQLHREIEAFVKLAKRKKLVPCVRLNGTSDIPWERIPCGAHKSIIDAFPGVQFYDYTKRHNRKSLPQNYQLTFSLSEDNDARALAAYHGGTNVAVVFKDKALPERYVIGGEEIPVFNGDASDLRFLDPKRVIVGLYAKGRARKDSTGFVR